LLNALSDVTTGRCHDGLRRDEHATINPDIAAGPVPMPVGVAPHAVDPVSAQRLWELSERLTG
jgi:hypothetical protein